MDTNRFAIVVFTMLLLFLIYLDNAGKLKNAVLVAKGGGVPASTGTGSLSVIPTMFSSLPSIPVTTTAPGILGMPGTTYGAPGPTSSPGTTYGAPAGTSGSGGGFSLASLGELAALFG